MRSLLSFLGDNLRSFAKALFVMLPWLVLIFVVYLLLLYHRAGTAAHELPTNTFPTATQVIGDTQGELTLVIAHPLSMLLDVPDQSRRPVAIWLLRATPTPGPSPTPHPARHLHPPLPDDRPTPNPYTVAFELADGAVEFTDEDGLPVLPQIVLTPALLPGTPAVLYLQPAHTSGPSPEQVELKTYVNGPGSIPLNASQPLSTRIGLESEGSSRWRRFWELLGETTTALVPLAVAFVGFAVQWWRQRAEEEQQAQQLREAASTEIESLGPLIERDPAEAVRRYLEFQERETGAWRDPRVKADLESLWRRKAPKKLQDGLELLMAYRRSKR